LGVIGALGTGFVLGGTGTEFEVTGEEVIGCEGITGAGETGVRRGKVLTIGGAIGAVELGAEP